VKKLKKIVTINILKKAEIYMYKVKALNFT